jgi:N-acetylmuramoyl-L-alanine amidase
LEEKTITLAVGLDLLTILRRDGYRVVLSRIQDEPVGRLLPASLSYRAYTPQGVHADLLARVACANAAHAQLLLSIHFDSFGDPTVGGTQTSYDPDRSFSRRSLRFARLVQQAVLHAFTAKGWNIADRQVVPDTQLAAPALTDQGAAYGHLLLLGPADRGWNDHPSAMPGALVEPLFLSDPTDADVVEHRAGQEVLAHALAQAINRYFGSSR